VAANYLGDICYYYSKLVAGFVGIGKLGIYSVGKGSGTGCVMGFSVIICFAGFVFGGSDISVLFKRVY
jgi:hypothetical protein